MKKKIWIILASVFGLLGVGGAVAYFLFWEDILLLLGEQPKTAAVSSPGGVNLVEDFTATEAPPRPQPAAGEAGGGGTDLASMPEEKVGEDGAGANLEETSGEDSIRIEEGDEEPEEEGAEPAAAAPEPPKPAAAPKKEPVPTISRKQQEPQEEDGGMEEEPAPTPAPRPAPPKPRKPPEEVPMKASPSVEIQKKAQMLIQRRKYREAEIMLSQYLAANPADGDVHFMAGFLHVQQNRKAMAITHFQKASIAASDPQIRQMAEQYLKKLR